MALLNVGGQDLPTPSELEIGLMDISKAERNANGTMILERVTTKRKLSIKYSYLTRTELKLVLDAVAGVFFTVEYPDPQTNSKIVGTFYCGDRNIGYLDYQNNVPRFRDISFDFVER